MGDFLGSQAVVCLLGLLSAFMFALGLVLQQRGTLETTAAEGDLRFLRQILRKRVWFFGVLALVCGFLLQAAALDHGTLALVQSLQALSVVFALPLGARLSRQRIGRRAIVGASVTVAGIVLLVAVGQPRGGISHPGARTWSVWAAVIATLMAAVVLVAWRRRGGVAAALFAAGAGLGFAFEAAVTKLLVTSLGNGLAAVFLSWPLYVLIVASLAGFALQQVALKTGCLAPATAALNSATLAMSVALGVAIYQESLGPGPGRLVAALLGLAVAVAGVVTLASCRSTPAGSAARQGVGPGRKVR